MAKTLKVLICGGGVGGPALAFWLARAGHRVTVIERYPALRAAGAQIDLRAQGIEVVKLMGLIPAIREKIVDEAGMQFVNQDGKIKATIKANKSGKGAQSFTSEYEIMRGDLVRILYAATQNDVEYVFGKTVESFDQDENAVTAHFSDGTSDSYDILVGADGMNSRTRRALLPPHESNYLHHLGYYTAYWLLPREEGDDNFAKIFVAAESRSIMYRSHSPSESQAYFSLKGDSEELRRVSKASIEDQKAFWHERFQNVGWQAPRLLKSMESADDFYFHPMAQVKIPTFSKGRVVLLADAAHCPSPMTGMGTTSAFVGAYVLAGEICQNVDDLPLAFENYDRVLKPFVTEIQKTHPHLTRLGYPNSKLGVEVLYAVTAFVCALRLPDLLARFASEEQGGWKLPDYPILTDLVNSQSSVKTRPVNGVNGTTV